MQNHLSALQLPAYDRFIETIAVLNAPICGSELHGVMCSYLCAGAVQAGEAYLRALIPNKHQPLMKEAILAIFGVFAVSQQQLLNFDFEFQMMLPAEDRPMVERAEAFRAWCDGFIQGMSMLGIEGKAFEDEETQEAFEHLNEFACLDYQALTVTEEDERALFDVNEYTRLAVLRIHHDLQASQRGNVAMDAAH